MIKIAPSLLSADFARVREQIGELQAAGADYFHLDVMDGRFVPNITWGPKVVADLRATTNVPFDCHLMIVEPERYVDAFREAGADIITFHYEATPHAQRLLTHIRASGAKAGLAINPGTPVEMITDLVGDIDLLLVMSVNPGFGGQKFIPHSLAKLREARAALKAGGGTCELEVDGGINTATLREAAAAGADVLVMGAALFENGAPGNALRAARTLLQPPVRR